MYDEIQRAAQSLKGHGIGTISTGLILGTGLGELPDTLDVRRRIAFPQIDGFTPASAPGHAGHVVEATWHGQRLLVFQGRFHLYEGRTPADVVRPVYVLAALGATRVVVTNAAGALNPDFAPADLMLIDDHLNFTGVNPLAGVDDERLGPRFPDMSKAYSPHLRQRIRAAASALGIALRNGIYVGVHGPSLETSAERRFFRNAGADAVGMSTVLEVIAANHCGLDVAGISAITNRATGGADQEPDTIDDVLHNAARAGRDLWQLLDAWLAGYGSV